MTVEKKKVHCMGHAEVSVCSLCTEIPLKLLLSGLVKAVSCGNSQ